MYMYLFKSLTPRLCFQEPWVLRGSVDNAATSPEVHKILYVAPHLTIFHELHVPSNRINSNKQM
jgi:hypothetical protein